MVCVKIVFFVRCLSIGEKERGLYNIIGFEYDGDKFAEIDDIEQDAATADTANTRLVLPVSNLDVVTEKLSTDRANKRFATATWNPSPDPHLRNYRVSYRQDDGDWYPTIMTFATNLRIEIDGPGVYEFTVTAINSFSFASGPITSIFTVAETGLHGNRGGSADFRDACGGEGIRNSWINNRHCSDVWSDDLGH